MNVYVIIGEREELYQELYDEDFRSHITTEIVAIYKSKSDAEFFISKNKLKTPKRESFSGTSNYKTGHKYLKIEEHTVVE